MTAAAEPDRPSSRRGSVVFHAEDETALAALRARWPNVSEMELVRRAVRLAARVTAPGVSIHEGRTRVEFFP